MARARFTSAGPHAGLRPPRRPSALAAQSPACALQGQLALELRHRGEDVEHEPPAGLGGVDLLGQHLQANAALLQVLGRLYELPDRAGEAVERPHHENVAAPDVVERRGKLRPVSLGARRFLREHSVAPQPRAARRAAGQGIGRGSKRGRSRRTSENSSEGVAIWERQTRDGFGRRISLVDWAGEGTAPLSRLRSFSRGLHNPSF